MEWRGRAEVKDPYEAIAEFERDVAEYTGAPYAVTVNSCTNALFLACKYCFQESGVEEISIPARTYRSVPMAIKHAGGKVVFDDRYWLGAYRLNPYPIWDAARRFTSDMYQGGFWCVSFHAKKILHDEQGGAILCSSPKAYDWLCKASWDGRTRGLSTKNDPITMLGYHCYMSPGVAKRLHTRLSFLPRHNEDMPTDDYEDLSQFQEVFR